MEFDDPSERLKQIVHIGKTRGYILYDEIDQFLLPTLEGDADQDIVSDGPFCSPNSKIKETITWPWERVPRRSAKFRDGPENVALSMRSTW